MQVRLSDIVAPIVDDLKLFQKEFVANDAMFTGLRSGPECGEGCRCCAGADAGEGQIMPIPEMRIPSILLGFTGDINSEPVE